MFKLLDIPDYVNGYSAEVNNCIDFTTAVASGKFNKENFFFYNAIWCILQNYQPQIQYDYKDEILNLLGLRIIPQTISSSSQLILEIKKHVDSGEPVLLPSAYSCLYYNKTYGNDTFLQHYCLFMGYRTTQDVIFSRDFAICREIISQLTKGTPICFVLFYI